MSSPIIASVRRSDNQARSASLLFVTWIGLVLNLLLTTFKITAGILGNSQAVIADGIHSLSDCATDITILVGVHFWSKPPDESHPYGHRRIETLVTIIIGLALAFVACGLGYNAMHTFSNRHAGPPGMIALIAALVSVGLKEWMYRWTATVGRRIRSTAMVANAWHHRSDAFSSIPVVVAVGASLLMPQLVWLDHLGAIVVSLFILYAAWDILRPALLELTDASASKKVRTQILDLAAAVPGVQNVHAIRTRMHAGVTQVDLHILVDPGISVHDGHDIADSVKRTVVEGILEVEDVLVHVEPFEETHHD